MERKLLTKRGRLVYQKRGQIVEPAFGQVKVVRGCDRFMRWGHSAGRSEWRLIWATHNLLKLWRHFLVRWGKARGLLCPHRVGPAWAA
ncbi:MAG: transposase [Bacillota bacterium]